MRAGGGAIGAGDGGGRRGVVGRTGAAARARVAGGTVAAALGIAALLLAGACGDAPAPEAVDAAQQATAAMERGDANAALSYGRKAWKPDAPDARLAYVMAWANQQLGRHAPAIDFAERGLGAEPDADLAADLNWARGRAHLERWRELKGEADWRSANAALDAATGGGRHRAESAALLALMQVGGSHENLDRFDRFARLSLELEPDGEFAASLRKAFAQLGREP